MNSAGKKHNLQGCSKQQLFIAKDWKLGPAGFELSDSGYFFYYMGVSKNRGTPKWMVYNGKPY